MGLVDHDPCIEAVAQLQRPGQIGNVPVHAVEPLDHDQHAAEFRPSLDEQFFQRVHVVMGEGQRRRARQVRTGDDAVMRQLVHENRVAAAEKMAKQGHVRAIAADEGERVADAEEFRHFPLELAMAQTFAADQPGGPDTRAKRLDRLDRRAINLGMTRQAEIIVMGEADELAALGLGVGRQFIDRREIRIVDGQSVEIAEANPAFCVGVQTVAILRHEFVP